METNVLCCSIEGTGIFTFPRFPRLTRSLVVPAKVLLIWVRYSGVLVYATKKFGSIFSENRIMVQSTAVTHFPNPSGNTHARPTGSGSLEIRMSPGYISVQWSLLNVSSVIYFALSPLSLYSPHPTFPVWISLMPDSDWSFDSIQYQSMNVEHKDDNWI